MVKSRHVPIPTSTRIDTFADHAFTRNVATEQRLHCDGGAEHWAVIASLIETCKLIGVEPHGYLAHVITRIVDSHPQSRLDELLPWAYPPATDLKAVA